MLVADLDAYPHWRGGEERWTEDAAYRVHYYGPLIAKLPARFQPSGAGRWHQYYVAPTSAAAKAFIDELRAEAERLAPGLTKREQKQMAMGQLLAKAREAADPAKLDNWLSAWRDHIEGGADFYAGDERVLHIDAKPDTDYARACENLDDVASVPLGDVTGLVWSLQGPGTARVGCGKDGFVLLRTWLDDEGRRERDARKLVYETTDEADAGTIAFASGRVAIVWAPVAAADLVALGANVAASLRAAADLNPPVQLNLRAILGVGTLVRVPPGDYRATYGAHKADDWSCRWLRFTAI